MYSLRSDPLTSCADALPLRLENLHLADTTGPADDGSGTDYNDAFAPQLWQCSM